MTYVFYAIIFCIFGEISMAKIFSGSEVKDICENESFSAQCSYDEVVVMETAVYGRMALGRCVKVDMGYISCKSNVIDIADDRCSGRKSCEIRIPDSTFEKTQPCLELKSYLQASYSCLKVITVDVNECRNSKFIQAYPPAGRIASVSTQDTRCGTRDIPWLIEAAPGTRINVTLTDFNAPRQAVVHGASAAPSKSSSFLEPPVAAPVSGTCHKYGVILEPATTEVPERIHVVCGRRTRLQQVFASQANVVQIQIESRRANPDYFVFEYKVFGCASPVIQDNALFKRKKNEAVIECKLTSGRWRLMCIGNEWVGGEIGNCTEPASYEIIGGPSAAQSSTGGTTIVIFGVCTFLVSLILILVAIVFYRRHRHRRLMRAALQPPIAMSMRRSKSGSKLEEEDLSYVRPSRGQQHTYGRSKRPHHHHHHSGGGGSSSCSGYGGAAENELNSECCSRLNYERVGFNTSTGKYLHIWEMPLPIPGES